jgi:hypothetical protein
MEKSPLHHARAVTDPESRSEAMVPVTLLDFGPNNGGSYGPAEMTDVIKLQGDARNPRYHRPASKRWVCVDGRGKKNEITGSDEVDPQIPGSLPVVNTAADLMNPATVGQLRLSQRLAVNTRAAIATGNSVVVHGDNHKKEAGCSANAKKRDVLQFGGENIDIIAPLVWGVSSMFGLEDHGVQQDDVVEALTAGRRNATFPHVWDVTPEQAIGVMVDNGAEYVELQDDHTECGVGMELHDELAFDNREFARDHVHEDSTEDEAFSVALGKYAHETFRERVLAGESPRDAALHVMRGIAYTVCLTKKISNELMRGWAFGKARKIELPE